MADDRNHTGTSEDKPSEEAPRPRRGAEAAKKAKEGADFVRLRLAQVVWFVCVLAALVLAAGALLISLGPDTVDRSNDLVTFLWDAGDRLDLGFFAREGGVFAFEGQDDAETKRALVNWGIAAVLWLIGGKIIDRVIRP